MFKPHIIGGLSMNLPFMGYAPSTHVPCIHVENGEACWTTVCKTSNISRAYTNASMGALVVGETEGDPHLGEHLPKSDRPLVISVRGNSIEGYLDRIAYVRVGKNLGGIEINAYRYQPHLGGADYIKSLEKLLKAIQKQKIAVPIWLKVRHVALLHDDGHRLSQLMEKYSPLVSAVVLTAKSDEKSVYRDLQRLCTTIKKSAPKTTDIIACLPVTMGAQVVTFLENAGANGVQCMLPPLTMADFFDKLIEESTALQSLISNK